jgi:hypothetical protein
MLKKEADCAREKRTTQLYTFFFFSVKEKERKKKKDTTGRDNIDAYMSTNSLRVCL